MSFSPLKLLSTIYQIDQPLGHNGIVSSTEMPELLEVRDPCSFTTWDPLVVYR